MVPMRARFLCSACLLLALIPAAAQQQVALQFNGGLVTLRAQNAPVRAILAEWARLGGATIVNGDRVAGPPVTLELTGVPERQALDIVLRNVAGYMLAPRRAGASGPSAFDRVMILPTSAAPRTPPPAAPAAGSRPALQRPAVLARPADPQESTIDMSQPEDASDDTQAQTPPQQGPPVDPRRGPRPFIRRPVQPGAAPGNPTGANQEQPAETPATPAPGTVGPTPANPFGIPSGSSSMPGVVAPQTQQTPANRVQ